MALGEPKWYTDLLLSKGTEKNNSFECPHCKQPITLSTSTSYDCGSPCGVGIEFSSSPFEKLPDVLDTGKLVEIIGESCGWKGKLGKIVDHYICGDDCSGNWGRPMYCVQIATGEKGSYGIKDCRLLN